MVVCLTGVRFNMKADILRQGSGPSPEPSNPGGSWVNRQDPDSGEIVRVWVPADNPDTPSDESGGTLVTTECIARGIVDGGIRAAGTTERFGDMYDNVDYVSMTVPAGTRITKRDRVTNIRNQKGIILWRNEENNDEPTVFSVLGVTPIPDPWGELIEQRVMLERAEIQ